MKHFSRIDEQKNYLNVARSRGLTIGFVATMGALHEGHIALIEQAKKENDLVVCSIFVNPLQFNRKVDLDEYPNRLEEDIDLLKQANCDILYTPKKEDIYPSQPDLNFDFGSIGKGMEAEYRPKHFEGVAAVINRFFEILQPTKAYFGEKDYQQLAIVRWLTKEKQFDTEVVGCETVRFDNGLAMSSRNFLLAEAEFKTASKIYQTLQFCKNNQSNYQPEELAAKCFKMLEEEFDPEYFIIADELTMKPIIKWADSSNPRAFVAAYLSTVRLIDNLSLNP